MSGPLREPVITLAGGPWDRQVFYATDWEEVRRAAERLGRTPDESAAGRSPTAPRPTAAIAGYGPAAPTGRGSREGAGSAGELVRDFDRQPTRAPPRPRERSRHAGDVARQIRPLALRLGPVRHHLGVGHDRPARLSANVYGTAGRCRPQTDDQRIAACCPRARRRRSRVIPPASLTASEARGMLASMCGRYASAASRADLLDAWRGR